VVENRCRKRIYKKYISLVLYSYPCLPQAGSTPDSTTVIFLRIIIFPRIT
jgi:hypothetical protein